MNIYKLWAGPIAQFLACCLLRFARMLILDCGVDTLAFVQFSKYLEEGINSLLTHTSVTSKLPLPPAEATPDQKRDACVELLKLLEASTKTAFQPSARTAHNKYMDFI